MHFVRERVSVNSITNTKQALTKQVHEMATLLDKCVTRLFSILIPFADLGKEGIAILTNSYFLDVTYFRKELKVSSVIKLIGIHESHKSSDHLT